MFLQELNPFLKELSQNPVAFLGGFVSGMLRLNLSEEPVKSWLENQAGYTPNNQQNGSSNNNNGPQSIDID